MSPGKAHALNPDLTAQIPACPPAAWSPPKGASDPFVATAVWRACITELLAIKPGNVGLHGDGHGMCANDFGLSASVAAPALGEPASTVGERVRGAVIATRDAVGCNTNLGIALLCAPLCMAAQKTGGTLTQKLHDVLASLDVHDTELVFEAIRVAAPAGLGASARHDVNEAATAPLLEVMREAAERDRIAHQYASSFDDVLGSGSQVLARYLNGWPGAAAGPEWPLAWAATGVYLHFLANFTDTHIYRKLGSRVADEVRAGAQAIERRFAGSAHASEIKGELLGLDVELKAKGINPGTSADLTVATLCAYELEYNRDKAVGGTREQ